MGQKEVIQADKTMHGKIHEAIKDNLAANLVAKVKTFHPVANGLPDNFQIGDIEDANVLIQNSLWLSVPLGQLDKHEQVVSLQDRRKWANNQVDQIRLIGGKFDVMAENLQQVCT